MRLIDADKIVQKTYGVVIEDMFHMHETVEVVSTIDIEKAPTVEAITVEWINDWLNTGRNAKYFITIMKMLEDWEKRK